MMKKKFIGIAASFLAVAGTGWFASGAQADMSTQNFVLVSNKTGDAFGTWGHSYTVCEQVIPKGGWQPNPPQCQTIPAQNKSVWWYYPNNVAQIVVTGLGRTFTENYPG